MYGARYDLPRLYNWMDATITERDIKPIRGKPDCKPLGKRRNTHVAIRKVDNEAVACRLYQTDVVTFHKDGRIVIRLDGWSSQTTIAFIEELLGVRTCIRHNHAWIGATRQASTQEGWYALRAHEDNIFRRNGQGDLEFENPMQIKTHRANRVRANNVRKTYKPFIDYIKRTMRLRDDGFSAQEYGDVFGWVHSELPNYPVQLWVSPSGNLNVEMVRDLLSLARSEQVQDQYKASLWLARSASKGMRNNRWTPSEADMLRMLGDYILLVHRDECFTETYAGGGEVVRDPYAKFFGR